MSKQEECKHKKKYKYHCASCEETHCEKCYTSSELWSSHSICSICDNLVEHFSENVGRIRDEYFHQNCFVKYLRYEHPLLDLHISDLERKILHLEVKRDQTKQKCARAADQIQPGAKRARMEK